MSKVPIDKMPNGQPSNHTDDAPFPRLPAQGSTAGKPPDWLATYRFAPVMGLLTATGVCGILCMDPEGTLTYSQGDVFDPALGPTMGVGKKLNRLFRPEVAEERTEVFAALVRQREPETIVVDMISGRELWWAAAPVIEDRNLAGLFAIGIRPDVHTVFPPGLAVKRLRHVCSAGPLCRLTPGELEVLRLLSLGRRREDMALDLKRTVKAVERRRTTLGRKLGVEQSAELAMIGVRAGLHRMSAAELERFARANCGPDAPESSILPSSA